MKIKSHYITGFPLTPFSCIMSTSMKMKKPDKAYKNLEFLNSREARPIRILSEYMEPEKRFEDFHITHTVVFFGSARISPEKNNGFDTDKYYWAAEELAYQLSKFSKELKLNGEGFTICSGGGPGIMEAANRGAHRAGAKNIGLNISIPFEQSSNKYISPELNFEFHYFFMRKLWFLYHAKAIIFFPGGFGTMDELFETLTLIQTHKMEKERLPILLYDEDHWRNIINFDRLVAMNLISPDDLNLIRFFSTPEDGMSQLKPRLIGMIEDYEKKNEKD